VLPYSSSMLVNSSPSSAADNSTTYDKSDVGRQICGRARRTRAPHLWWKILVVHAQLEISRTDMYVLRNPRGHRVVVTKFTTSDTSESMTSCWHDRKLYV
jgi:hypothetical protein